MATRKAAKKKAVKKAPKKKAQKAAKKKAGKKAAKKKAGKKAGKKKAAAPKKAAKKSPAKKGAKKATKKASARSSTANGARNGVQKRPKWLPPGYNVVNAHLVVDGAEKAMAFYRDAFGAVETSRMPGPDGKIMHAEMKIGDTLFMLADDMPEMQGGKSRAPSRVGVSTGGLMLYTEDADALMARAEKAGGKVTQPLQDQFWGDRFGSLQDPFGHEWSIATHIRDVSPEEMMAAMAAMSAQMGAQPQPGAEMSAAGASGSPAASSASTSTSTSTATSTSASSWDRGSDDDEDEDDDDEIEADEMVYEEEDDDDDDDIADDEDDDSYDDDD